MIKLSLSEIFGISDIDTVSLLAGLFLFNESLFKLSISLDNVCFFYLGRQ